MSKSIWNENPNVYFLIRDVISAILTCFYPFLFYVVIFQSPKSFGSLKWFLLFHIVAITIQWLSTFIFIEFYTFVPSKITRIDGFLIDFVDSKILYRTTYFLNSLASASCLLLFWNRIFSILNMYRGVKSKIRTFLEVLVYLGTLGFSCSIVVTLQLPDQEMAKNITKMISPYYPDCLDSPQVVLIIIPYPEIIRKVTIFYSIFLLSTSLVTFLTAQLAYHLLLKRMKNQSEKTKRMHKKFNYRTFFQVLVDNTFSSIPFIISNLATLFELNNLPELTYLVDILSKNNPTACIFVLFLYYDPYNQWLKRSFRILRTCKSEVELSRTATSVIVKSGEN